MNTKLRNISLWNKLRNNKMGITKITQTKITCLSGLTATYGILKLIMIMKEVKYGD